MLSDLVFITGQINDLYCTRGRNQTIQLNLHLVKLILQETYTLLQSCDHSILPNDKLRCSGSLTIEIVIKTINRLGRALVQIGNLEKLVNGRYDNQMSTSSPCLPSRHRSHKEPYP